MHIMFQKYLVSNFCAVDGGNMFTNCVVSFVLRSLNEFVEGEIVMKLY